MATGKFKDALDAAFVVVPVVFAGIAVFYFFLVTPLPF